MVPFKTRAKANLGDVWPLAASDQCYQPGILAKSGKKEGTCLTSRGSWNI
jgi:hypothetical protein